MSKRLTATQFSDLCSQYGKDKFISQAVDIIPGQIVTKNKILKEMTSWLDKNCVQPYYVNWVPRGRAYFIRDIVFYFMDPQDKMIFTLCFYEYFK